MRATKKEKKKKTYDVLKLPVPNLDKLIISASDEPGSIGRRIATICFSLFLCHASVAAGLCSHQIGFISTL